MCCQVYYGINKISVWMCGYVTSQNNNDNNGCMGTVLMYGCLTYVWVPYSCTGTVLMYGYRTYVWVPYSCTGAVLMYGYRTHVWVPYSCMGFILMFGYSCYINHMPVQHKMRPYSLGLSRCQGLGTVNAFYDSLLTL